MPPFRLREASAVVASVTGALSGPWRPPCPRGPHLERRREDGAAHRRAPRREHDHRGLRLPGRGRLPGLPSPRRRRRRPHRRRGGAGDPAEVAAHRRDRRPVTDLATARVTIQELSCSSGIWEGLVEETVAGDSDLQHLGDGSYRLNWESPTPYAGPCKTLRLDLREGVDRMALFRSRAEERCREPAALRERSARAPLRTRSRWAAARTRHDVIGRSLEGGSSRSLRAQERLVAPPGLVAGIPSRARAPIVPRRRSGQHGRRQFLPPKSEPKGVQLQAVVPAHARDPHPTPRGSIGRSRCTPASTRSSAIRALVAPSAKPR